MEAGAIVREIYSVEMPREEYSLRPLGETFVETLAALCKWAE